jgi:hypothetical protein
MAGAPNCSLRWRRCRPNWTGELISITVDIDVTLTKRKSPHSAKPLDCQPGDLLSLETGNSSRAVHVA